jgi:hypothetical protein
MNISILTSQKKYRRGFNDFHPIYRWRNELKVDGFSFKFCENHKKLKDGDVLILDYRYPRSLFGDWTEDAKQFTISLCKALKNNFGKIIFFDTGDSAGSKCFGVLKYVDVFWKKQVYKNFEYYLTDNGEKNWMRWLPNELNSEHRKYDIPQKKDLRKIKVAWNIGLSGYYDKNQWIKALFENSILSKSLFKSNFKSAYINGEIDTCYRVSMNKSERYCYQRKLVVKCLDKLNTILNSKYGTKVSKKQYMLEMENSRIIISPYGWGEICYRDFEAIINGSLLVKPDMSHINTFPNIFIDTKTYIPIAWDISDLEETLVEIKKNPRNYKEIAFNAQELLKPYLIDPNIFVKHFQSIL